MRPPITAPFTVYCEEQVQAITAHLDGHVTRPWRSAIPVGIFVNDVWQSAKREGYIEGHIRAQVDLCGDEHGNEPSASVVGDWRKKAAKKAMGA
jgi:hypothetical protein